ncbi:hypothetical protein GQ607_007249 [Colletotrichum asianum]|uniref:Uncharacterized protein n=1 Tax=Colletotrichum asianum TaxID=702518 RepID=A0A8H3WCJ4_9PEZI|nr:hypothetical protein GQ607_007249 [Colletotrichum asianum]
MFIYFLNILSLTIEYLRRLY